MRNASIIRLPGFSTYRVAAATLPNAARVDVSAELIVVRRALLRSGLPGEFFFELLDESWIGDF